MPELVHTETEEKTGIEYRLMVEQDDIEVRGNAIASGDDAADKAVEDEILSRLNDGDAWAWAAVTVKAVYKGFHGSDHLGACSYRDTAEFIQPGGYWDDMKKEARANLIRLLTEACESLEQLQTAS